MACMAHQTKLSDLENVCAKATGALALETLLERQSIAAETIDFIIT